MSPLENVLLIVISYKDKYDLDFFKWTQYIKQSIIYEISAGLRPCDFCPNPAQTCLRYA